MADISYAAVGPSGPAGGHQQGPHIGAVHIVKGLLRLLLWLQWQLLLIRMLATASTVNAARAAAWDLVHALQPLFQLLQLLLSHLA
jgi:hypothetical protein